MNTPSPLPTRTSAALPRYAVIGNPVAHSKSPGIHAAFAAQTGQAMVYEHLLAPLDGFAASVRCFMAQGGQGANVTVPFKLEAFALADTLSERARLAGAVNTLLFAADGCIHGDNTDGQGLVTDMVGNAGWTMAGKRILLLGAGGAARGVLLPMLAQAPRELVIGNRTVSKADELVAQLLPFARQCRLSASDFPSLCGRFDLVINATSASIAAQVPPLPAGVIGAGTLAYDMMYGAEPTVFLRHALDCGGQVRDGIGMLVEQAAESFYLWRGVRPDTTAVLQQLRDGLRAPI
ncbi:MAG: shikimate dehydrogenase [Janthinobacterium lividum]